MSEVELIQATLKYIGDAIHSYHSSWLTHNTAIYKYVKELDRQIKIQNAILAKMAGVELSDIEETVTSSSESTVVGG